jgi:hypothetical protein
MNRNQQPPQEPASGNQPGHPGNPFPNIGNNGNPANNQNPAGGNQPNNGNSNQPTNNPEQMQDPMKAYANMWNPATPDQNNKPPEYTINPEIMKKVTDSMDFAQGLPQELAEKLQSGEQLSGQEIVAMMNHVGRTTYAHAMNHQSKLTEKFVGLHGEHFQKNLPQQMKKYLTNQRVRGLPSAQGNPVVQQHMEQIAERLTASNPDASDEWIAEQTKNYFVNMARMISPDEFPTSSSGRAQPNEIDWDAFMLSGQKDQA